MEDNELVEAYKEGEEPAFEELVVRYAKRLFAFTFRLSGDRAVAEDAVQETFVKAWKNLGKFDTSRSFRSWIFSIARNATIDIMRAKKSTTFSALDSVDEHFSSSLADAEILPDIVFDQVLEQKMLEDILSQLSVNSRTVVILHDIEGLTFEEIGEIIKEPMNTVKSRYRRAILALKDKIAPKA